MTAINGTYTSSAEVTFEYDAETVDPFYYIEEGERIWRMRGIYEHITTEAEMFDHLAYNAIVNNVTDASRLDGWADLERGQLTMRVHGIEFDRA
jgi:hypothetical protein